MSHRPSHPLLRTTRTLPARIRGVLRRPLRPVGFLRFPWPVPFVRALATIALLLSSSLALADPREFPPSARPGTLVMGVYPEAGIDGRPVRFAPGARIRDRANMLVLPAALEGRLRIRYTLDGQGLVDRAWLLTDEEAALAAKERR